MRILARVLIVIFLTALWFILGSASSFAEGEFSTKYDVNYVVDNSGLTVVTQKIILENKTPNFYADKFQLKIGSTRAENVTATDSTGNLDTEVKYENNLTTIVVTFNQKVIGTGKTLSWTLNYSSNELAIKNGQIWEISIPRLAKSSDINEYKATVSVPAKFGVKAFALPNPDEEVSSASTQIYSFTKDQLLDSGIAMSFGDKQVFKFKLDYLLENNSVTSQIKEITLPPDNNYQQIVLEKLEPKPLDVVVDDDGNFVAQYKLPARNQLKITAEGFVEVFHKPFRNIDKELTTKQKDTYVQPQSYWETDNAFIQEKAIELKTPEKIYDFVVNFLSYSETRLDSGSVERKGAVAAISDPQNAICMEFTDLYIAISRAAGIPTREVVGFAYTQNEKLRPLSLAIYDGDILHAWPEYWDDNKGWLQIDPTWGSTSGGLDYFNKLDFNHITFVQRGISSTNPAPAGAYKSPGAGIEKSVFIEFADELPTPTLAPELAINLPSRIISGIPLSLQSTVKNIGSTTIYMGLLSMTSEKLKITGPNSFEVDILPPFASRQYDFRLTSEPTFRTYEDTLVLSFLETQISSTIDIHPLYNLFTSPSFFLIIAIIMLIIATSLIVHKKIFKKSFTFPKLLKS